jgi:hypothetical protein
MMKAARFLVAALAAASVLGTAPGAGASHVQCGDVITQDTRLDSDLVDCHGVGLVIGAAGVTLDLGGHTIDGAGGDQEEDLGILNQGFDGATIRNGFIRDSFQGVRINASENTVRHVVVDDLTTYGSAFSIRGDRNRVEHNGALGGGLFVSGDYVRIAHNLVTDEAEDTFMAVSGVHATVVHNEVHIGGAVCRGLEFELDHSLLAQNSLFGSSRIGNEGECFGFLGTGEDTLVKHNTAIGASTGFSVFGDLVLEGNIADRNGWNGITAGAGLTLTRNTANGNGNLGIEARTGAIDGGGNRASGNGNPAQCVGVTCK